MNFDSKLDESEFMAHFESPLYYLVLEDVLTKPFTKITASKISPLAYLFPYSNSTINESQISDLLRNFDLDDSNTVTRQEIFQLFQTHKDLATHLFVDRIE